MANHKCVNCNNELIFVETIGWIHPTTECLAEDGIVIEPLAREEWNKKYPYDITLLSRKELEDNLKGREEQLADAAIEFKELEEDYEELVNERDILKNGLENADKNYQSTLDYRIRLKAGELNDKIKKVFSNKSRRRTMHKKCKT